VTLQAGSRQFAAGSGSARSCQPAVRRASGFLHFVQDSVQGAAQELWSGKPHPLAEQSLSDYHGAIPAQTPDVNRAVECRCRVWLSDPRGADTQPIERRSGEWPGERRLCFGYDQWGRWEDARKRRHLRADAAQAKGA
jgi:hypothetical protein